MGSLVVLHVKHLKDDGAHEKLSGNGLALNGIIGICISSVIEGLQTLELSTASVMARDWFVILSAVREGAAPTMPSLMSDGM